MFEDRIEKLRNFYVKERRLPSYSEMIKVLGYKSKGGVTGFVERMIDQGVLGKKDGKLFPINLRAEIKILGTVSAGFPSLGEEVFSQSILLEDWIISDPKKNYILQVEGDSMIKANIASGDYVVVEITNDIEPGMIVIAEIDGEWTMKYLRTRGGVKYLEAANDKYPDMHPEGELNIHAKVISVIRKYD
ncbi:MAG: SOS regulatory protein LexA [Crocinitomicaceae bacterium]|jgi:SOS regulatory protein LexA